jgi:hypothetical protein
VPCLHRRPLARFRPTAGAAWLRALVERRTLGRLGPVRCCDHAARQGARPHRHRARFLDPCLRASLPTRNRQAPAQLPGL